MKEQTIYIYQTHKKARLTLIEDGKVIVDFRGPKDTELLRQLTEVDKKRFNIDPENTNFPGYEIDSFHDCYLCRFLVGRRLI